MVVEIKRTDPGVPRWRTVLKCLLVIVVLYVFLGGMAMMGDGLKALGKNPDYEPSGVVAADNRPYRDVVYDIFTYADDPVVGFFVGILVTAVFQSSSFTTSFVVSLVVTTPLTLHQAIFIVMGANIGTSITAVGVSFTHVRRQQEFARAYGAATVHEFFKMLTVLVFFPLEWVVWRLTGTGVLERASSKLAVLLCTGRVADQSPTNPIKEAVRPMADGLEWLLDSGFGLSHEVASVVISILGIVLLLVALILMTMILRSLVVHRVERFFDKVLFRNAGAAFVVGLILTAIVQSSSVTTSLVVPLAGTGLLTIGQVLPYTLGAAIGTTVTAMLASVATSADTPEQAQVGVALACSHLLFNVFGSMVWYPFRRVPITIAQWFGGMASRSRRLALMLVLGVFFGLPILAILVSWLLG